MNRADKMRGKVRKLKAKQWSLCVVLWVTMAFGVLQTVHAQQKPNWLKNYPADPLYYIGIGGIEKDNNKTDYQSKAREIALGQLISQIEVNVASNTETSEKEIDGDYENSFSQLIQLQAQKTIEDYEVVDSWESSKEYWIYLRLSKQKYEQRLKEKIEQAQLQAYKAFTDGERESLAGNYGSSLSHYVKALGDISAYRDRLSLVSHNGVDINLYAELRSKIQQTIHQLEVDLVEGPEEVRIGKSGALPFSLKVVSRDGKPVNGLPFRYSFIRGEGELEKQATTGSDGIAKAQLSKLTSDEKLQIVTAELDLNNFLSEENSSEVIQNLLGSFTTLSARYVIKASGIPVYLDYSETFLGEQKTTNYIQPVLKQFFSEGNYVFTDAMSEAELFMELETEAREGSETYGLFSAFVDYRITVTSLESGEEVATYAVTDIKGISDSYEKAAAKAYEAGMDSLEQNLIPRLFTQLQK